MKIYKTDVVALETTFEVEYLAFKGSTGSYFEPTEPPELDIVKISIDGNVLDGLLSDFAIDEIYKALEKQIECDIRQSEEDIAESRSESWTE